MATRVRRQKRKSAPVDEDSDVTDSDVEAEGSTRARPKPRVSITAADAASAYASKPIPEAADGGLDGTLSKEEMRTIASGCLSNMEKMRAQFKSSPSERGLRAMGQEYTSFLVTAIFCLGLAPRSQVLKELQVGKTMFRKEDGHYWIELPAELNKNRKPSILTLPSELTPCLDFYLNDGASGSIA